MKELQKFTKHYQEERGWNIPKDSFQESQNSLLNNYMLLTTEVAEVAEELRKAFNMTHQYIEGGLDEDAAFLLASEKVKEDISKELADCLAYMMKFANFFELDLEESFYAKMEEVKNRKNKDVASPKRSSVNL